MSWELLDLVSVLDFPTAVEQILRGPVRGQRIVGFGSGKVPVMVLVTLG